MTSAPAARDWLAGAAFALGFLALLGAAEALRRFARVPPEGTRKLVHVCAGLGCLALPFVIESHWVVLALALLLCALFLGAHRTGRLASLHGVERQSRGVEYYPLVVYALFLLTRTQAWLYVIALLVLAIADALAALIGTRYGRLRYEVDGESKSLEGSLAFLVTTFLVVLLPLVLWDDPALPEPARCVLAALLTALLVTGFEAVSLGGRDNLWVPLGTYFVLVKILRQPLGEIAVQNACLVATALAIGLAAVWTRVFNVGGAIVFALWAYACWSLGSLDWAVPIFAGFAAYLVLRPFTRMAQPSKVRAVLRALLPSVVLLFAANLALATRWSALYPILYAPFLAAATLVLVQLSWSRILVRWRPQGARSAGALGAALACAALVSLPAWALQSGVPLRSPLTAGVVALLGGVAHDRFLSLRPAAARAGPSLVLTGAAALVALLLQALGLGHPWNPR